MFKVPGEAREDVVARRGAPEDDDDEFEPYVRRKRAEAAGGRKKMQGLNEQEQNMLRNSINSRERRRMHELNDEFETLRECLPYPNEANSRRMSKANTLLLASNWIKQLANANHRLTSELAAAHAKIDALMSQLSHYQQTDEAPPTSSFTSSSGGTSSSKCAKCQQNACFFVDCLTSSATTTSNPS